MKIKNISEADFNLKSGKLAPGKSAEATFEECQVLFSSNMAEYVTEAPVAKEMSAPKKTVSNG